VGKTIKKEIKLSSSELLKHRAFKKAKAMTI
jgi:hypothetical protein